MNFVRKPMQMVFIHYFRANAQLTGAAFFVASMLSCWLCLNIQIIIYGRWYFKYHWPRYC